MANYHINLHQAIYSLSDALDLVGVNHIHHGKRVAYMATEIARELSLPQQQLDSLFQAAILHDCGVSKTAVHLKLAQLSWEHESDHCRTGADLLSSCPLLSPLAPIVLHHHTHWCELKDLDLPSEVKLAANCIYLADRTDILTLQHHADGTDILLGMEKIRQAILERSGDWFSPELVDAFMRVSRSEVFWFMLETNRASGYIASWLIATEPRSMSFEELRSLVQLFSKIVDAKSSFTKEHSDGVAALARHLGMLFELPLKTCEMLELAGLLHDIGKLRIPDELLEKPGPFTDEETTIMHRHSFDTYNILRNITGLDEICAWAAQHHERLDGSGYHNHMGRNALSLEARIVEVADVFQALAQHRPYRDALPPDEILAIIRQDASTGRLDADVVAKTESHLQECWRVAMRMETAAMA